MTTYGLKITHDTTKKEVFDFVKAHLLKQNRRSSNGYRCLYRHPTSETVNACAVGCLIFDEEYRENMEGAGVGGLSVEILHHMPSFRPNNDVLRLLNDLQGLHDRVAEHQWSDQLDNIAKEHKL